MAGLNTKLFSERVGQIKIFSIILGIVAVILAADHYATNITEEKAFWWSIVVCTIISIILAVFSLFGMMDNEHLQKFDKIYHALAAILLIITACFFIVSVDKDSGVWKSYYERRAAAGGFGLIFGVVCGYIGWFLF
ncbi:uncharacterized protein LOC110848704 [Folsomia candida]|uniref:MARVEL domain-containing protein n=1 Tax=Folsomia candida TaxID=158441 RepID=A0A226EF78_FOLCA|nr:uncharacterized protein LOC110848704 [Folsomia candida]OXA55336.1 hypothetical protein Fcan01_08592 [Folsomia candida]